ncbi:MAG TPA: hypothetical protein VFF53_03120 [Geobacteraceae bacterium]|nr:hypothetical protein [Geobacteraceae bacterium]
MSHGMNSADDNDFSLPFESAEQNPKVSAVDNNELSLTTSDGSLGTFIGRKVNYNWANLAITIKKSNC